MREKIVILVMGLPGSGKTTLINLILTLISPSDGQIEVDQKVLEKNNLDWLKNAFFTRIRKVIFI